MFRFKMISSNDKGKAADRTDRETCNTDNWSGQHVAIRRALA